MVQVERGDIFYCVMRAAKEKVTPKLFENRPWLLVCSWEGSIILFMSLFSANPERDLKLEITFSAQFYPACYFRQLPTTHHTVLIDFDIIASVGKICRTFQV